MTINSAGVSSTSLNLKKLIALFQKGKSVRLSSPRLNILWSMVPMHMRFRITVVACTFVLIGSSPLFGQKPQNNAALFQHPAKERTWHYTSEGRWDDVDGVPRELYHVNYGPMSSTPEAMARTFLTSSRARFKMTEGLVDLQTAATRESPAGHHVRFDQYYQGIPVYKSDVVVTIDRNNFVTFVSNNYRPGIVVPGTQASITGDAANRNAHAAL
jgi:hypothetical protein